MNNLTKSVSILLFFAIFAVFGNNLIKNGDFSQGIDFWTQDYKSCILTSGGILSIEHSGNDNSEFFQKISSLMPGEQYTLAFEYRLKPVRGKGCGQFFLRMNGMNPVIDVLESTEWKKYDRTIIAGDSSVVLGVKVNGNIALEVRNITLYTGAAEKTGVVSSENSDGFVLRTPFFNAALTKQGGKIISLSSADKEWCAQIGNARIDGIGKLWFEGLPLKDDTKVKYVFRQKELEGSGGIEVTAVGKTDFFDIRKTYTFHPNQKIFLHVALTNRSMKEFAFSMRIHNYLSIFRTGKTTPLFSLFASLPQKMYEYRMIEDCPSDIELKNADFAAVVDNGKRSFIISSKEKADYYVWSGFRKDNGTLELKKSNIILKQGETFSLHQDMYCISGLPSIGRVTSDFIFSVSNPEFYLVSLTDAPEFDATLRIEGGNVYSCRRNTLAKGDIVNVVLSSISDPGKRTFVYSDSSFFIPSYTEVLPVDRSGVEPRGYIRKYGRAIPKPSIPDSLIYFPSDYYQMNVYASPDAITMIAIGQSVSGNPSGEAFLHLYLPEGITPLGGRFLRSMERLPDEVVNGEKRVHFKISFTYGIGKTRPGITELLVRCTIPAPARFDAYYATEHNGRFTEKYKAGLHIINIPEAGCPKKMFTSFIGLHGTLDSYPDVSAFARIGLCYPDENFLRNVVKSNVLTYSVPAQGYLRFAAVEQDAWSIDRSGHKSGELACPTYRGRGVSELIQQGKDAIDQNVMLHGFDPERTNGLDVCFCRRCIRLFIAHAGRHGFKLPETVTRAELVKMCESDKKLETLRLEFMIRHETERYRMYADAVRSYARSKGLPEKLPILTFAARSGASENPERLRNSSYEDVAQLGKIFDNFSPMLYIDIKHRFVMKTDLDWIDREIKAYYRLGGPDLNLVPFLSVGYPYSTFIGNIEPGVMKAQILEAYASGAKGVVIYSEGWYDALDMKQTAEAMKIILQAEDIFLKGHPIPDHRLENKAKNTLLKGIETSPGNAVLLVSDYSEHEKEAVIHYHFDGKAIVTDMETGKTIAEISAAKPYFKVKLSEVRTKMLRIKMEPADHKTF